MQDYFKALIGGLLALTIAALCLYSTAFATDAVWENDRDGQSGADYYDHFGEELPPDEEEVQLLDSGEVLDSGLPPDVPRACLKNKSCTK